MAGKPKDELPKLEEWQAPWEVDKDGKPIPEEEQKIDGSRLKRYLHGLLGDKLKLQGQVEETTVRAEELEKKVAEAVDPAKLVELQAEVTKTRQERDEAAAKAEKSATSDIQVLKYEVALDKGLTKVQAKRLLGSTREELEQDAEELLASFGATGKASDEEEGGVARGPKRSLTNSGDPKPDADKGEKEEIDPDKWAADVYAKRRLRL